MTTKRGTRLLVSGWWGLARKINYTGGCPDVCDLSIFVGWLCVCVNVLCVMCLCQCHSDGPLCKRSEGRLYRHRQQDGQGVI